MDGFVSFNFHQNRQTSLHLIFVYMKGCKDNFAKEKARISHSYFGFCASYDQLVLICSSTYELQNVLILMLDVWKPTNWSLWYLKCQWRHKIRILNNQVITIWTSPNCKTQKKRRGNFITFLYQHCVEGCLSVTSQN